MVANLDANVARLLEAVRNEGLADDTIFVFTSDHGEMFGAQGRHAKNIFYEESVRVPFLIRWGDKLPKGKNYTCFNTVDIMPTLLTMMGLPVPDTVQGTDISDCIQNGTRCENNCLMMGTGPTAIYGNGVEWRGIRSDRYTYATYKCDGSEYLFDNQADPYQLHNLIHSSEHEQVLHTLRGQMYAMMRRIGDNFEKNSYYKKHWVDHRKILPELK